MDYPSLIVTIIVIIIVTIITGFIGLYRMLSDFHNYNDCIIYIKADWCGVCRHLDDMKLFDKLGDIRVITMDEKYKTAKMLMKKVKSNGYPTIIICKRNKIVRYKGPFNPRNLIQFYDSV